MTEISDSVLGSVARMIERRSGLFFPPEKWADLRKGLAGASAALGLPGGRELAERLLSPNPPADWLKSLLDQLTVGETYFFRESGTLDALESRILPELVRERSASSRSLRVWSAGCSTGEEPYTLSILLLRSIPDIARWNVSVLATDLNTESLRKAQEGIYTAWSFRGTPEWVKEAYFRPAGEHAWSVSPMVRKLVRFDRLNLNADRFPAPWNGTSELDLIFCRNVLMYFSPAHIDAVLRGYLEALVPGGYLVVSATELSLSRFEGFERVEHGSAFCFRKPPVQARLEPPRPQRTQAARRSHHAGAAGSAVPQFSPRAHASAAPVPPRHGSPSVPAGAPPSLPDSGYPLAVARRCADEGRFDEAALHCRAALESDPMNPAAYYLYGVVLQEKGDPAAAAREFRRAIYLDPEFVAPYVSLGRILAASGNPSEAVRHFRNALAILERYPNDEVVRESGGTTIGALAAMIRSIGIPGEAGGEGGNG